MLAFQTLQILKYYNSPTRFAKIQTNIIFLSILKLQKYKKNFKLSTIVHFFFKFLC